MFSVTWLNAFMDNPSSWPRVYLYEICRSVISLFSKLPGNAHQLWLTPELVILKSTTGKILRPCWIRNLGFVWYSIHFSYLTAFCHNHIQYSYKTTIRYEIILFHEFSNFLLIVSFHLPSRDCIEISYKFFIDAQQD